MKGDPMDFANAAMSALATGVLQGVLLVGGVALVLRLLRRGNAATRYAVAFAALLSVAALPVIHGLGLDSRFREAIRGALSFAIRENPLTRFGPAEGLPPAQGRVDASADGSGILEIVRANPIRSRAPERASIPLAAHLPGPIRNPGPGLEDPATRTPVSAGYNAGLPWSRIAGSAMDSTSPEPAERSPDGNRSDPTVWRMTAPRGVALGLLVLWVAMAAIRLVRLGWQCRALQRLRDQGVAPAEPMREAFVRWCSGLRVTRGTDLRVLPGLASPMLVGWFRPTVLMPEDVARCAPEVWEPMLIHELAHVRRWDDWTNLIHQGLVGLFFFHPGVLWLSRRLSIEREIACDDHVLTARGSPRKYALLLTEHARRRQGPEWATAPAAWSKPSQLQERIHMLLDTRRNASPQLARMRAGAWTTTVLLLAALGFYAAPRLSLAATGDSPAGVSNTSEASAGSATASDLGSESVTATRLTTSRSTGATLTAIDEIAPEQRELGDPADSSSAKIKGPRGATLRTAGSARMPMQPPAPPVGQAPVVAPVAVQDIGASPVPAAEVRVAVAPPTPDIPGPRDVAVRAPKPAMPPAGIRMQLAHAGDRQALEKRLEMLERTVQKLLEEREDAWGKGNLKWKSSPEKMPRFDGKFDWSEDPNLKAIVEQARQEARQQAERATREVERATRELERNAREAGARAAADARAGQSLEAKRRPLEEQRRLLERQIGQLEAQMERIEEALESLDHAAERLAEEQPKLRERERDAYGDPEDSPDKAKAPKPEKAPRPAKAPEAERAPGVDAAEPFKPATH